jgi:hypothetical protein
MALGLAYRAKIIIIIIAPCSADTRIIRHRALSNAAQHAAAQQHAALCTAASVYSLHSSIISTGIIRFISISTSLMCESGTHQQTGEPHARRRTIYCTQHGTFVALVREFPAVLF